jgi:hypothetical protein
MRRWIAIFAASVATMCGGCGGSQYNVARPPPQPFDAIVVPGCPCEDDGRLSHCQMGQAGNAARLWQEGWTRNFIVSGSDVHTPYVEAEAIAQAMTTLGVPPAHILIERDALHSDENIYYSLLLAKRAGFARLAVTSFGSVAGSLCRFMVKFGHECAAIQVDIGALDTFLKPREPALRALRATRVQNWEPLGEREERIAKVNGHGRPPSFVLYPLYGWLGDGHKPIAPEHPEIVTWDAKLAETVPASTP